MASERSIFLEAIWAAAATTPVPATPTPGIVYRDGDGAAATVAAGWRYANVVDSSQLNQTLFIHSTLLQEFDKRGIPGWSSAVDYDTVPAVVRGSDGVIYVSTDTSGPNDGDGTKDPTSGANRPDYWVDLATALGSRVPAGMVAYYAEDAVPDGWLAMDGSAISRTTYDDLFDAIGTVYGVGNGSTTFNLPDARGLFFRGFDDGAGVDDGRTFGSVQQGSVLPFDAGAAGAAVGVRTTATAVGGVGHDDVQLDYDASIATNYPDALYGSANASTAGALANTAEVGAGIVRPVNIAFTACIKY